MSAGEVGHARVIWITGLSGAGKSSLATEVAGRRRAAGHPIVLLDGDVLRQLLGADLGHTPAERLLNAERMARLCRFLSGQGVDVVAATMSLFPDVQAWNRAHIPGYLEVFLRVPLEELKRRDARGLYGRAAAGEARNVVGVDLPFHEPATPDLVLGNDYSRASLEGNAATILERAFRGA
jgi:cytidine diphosphoramidate kinase